MKTRKFKHRFVCVTETRGVAGSTYRYWSSPSANAAADRARAINAERNLFRRAYALDSQKWDIGQDNIMMSRAA